MSVAKEGISHGRGDDYFFDDLVSTAGGGAITPGMLEGLVKKSGEIHDPATLRDPLAALLKERPQLNPNHLLAEVKTAIGFEELDRGLQIKEDVINLVRHLPGGKTETYTEKLVREEQRGEKEAASYGTGHIGDQEIVFFAMHWNFFNGTLSSVVGEKFQRAFDLAKKKKKPIVVWHNSAGVRQQENVPGLVQMIKMVNAISEFKSETNLPYVSVLCGNVWGGDSASGVPLGDITVAYRGTDYGFSGPKVIESYQQKPVPPGAQSAEANVLTRNLDVLVNDTDDLLHFIGSYLSIAQHRKEKVVLETPYVNSTITNKGREIFPAHKLTEDELYAMYIDLMKNPNRPSMDYFLDHCFTNVVKLYSSVRAGDLIINPSVAAAIGEIDRQRFLIVGTLPSYQKVGDRLVKIPASASPEDLGHRRRMLEFGARNGLPLVSFVDIPGAKPTLEAERAGQSREIALNILAGIEYQHPEITVINGMLGSGGGLAVAPWEKVFMTSKGLACVAEPISATSILASVANPSVELVKKTLGTMRASAFDQLDLKIIDGVVPEPDGEYTPENQLILARNVRDCIVAAYKELSGIRPSRRMTLRRRRIRGLGIGLKE